MGLKTKNFEFGGPLGAVGMVAGLPVAVLLLNLACNKTSCSVFHFPSLPTMDEFFSMDALVLFVAWFGFQILLSMIPVGSVAKGLPLENGHCLEYRCNGFAALVISVIVFGVLVLSDVQVGFVHDKFLALATSAILFSFTLSIFLYTKSFAVSEIELADGGKTGVSIYDFFIGRELNPRIGPVDLKFFCELRPGLIGWVILDLCFISEAYKIYGQPALPLVLVVASHILYVADALWHEEAILTTMDIVHDGFGYMLVFGDLTWVPFIYCLQARFLLEHPQPWTYYWTSAVAVLNVIGFFIFRASNSQKNNFRKGAPTSEVKTLSTASGRQLLISGWWGLSRHPNYCTWAI